MDNYYPETYETKNVISNVKKYKELHRRMWRSIKESKQSWLKEKCVEIEITQAKHDNFHKKRSS